jgi:hypothetical protein
MGSEKLLTRAEATDYQETSRHSDVVAFVDALVARTPLVTKVSLGTSGEGQDMVAMVLGGPDPRTARKRKKAVVMVEANIHAGEVEGKEMVLALARDLTVGPLKALGKKLPLFRRLRMRTLVEAHFQADQYESHAAALKSVAIARIVR